jgi:hypothetical protein
VLKWAVRATGVFAALAVIFAVGTYFFIFARPHPSDPRDALVSFEDWEAFVSTYELAQANDHAVRVYAENYFARDTAPVRTYVSSLGASAERATTDIRDRPDFYETLIARASELAATESDIRAAYARFEERYPSAVYPPVYVLYGGYQARALIRPSHILVGGEYFIGGDDVHDREDPDNLNGLMNRPTALPGQVIHELAHIQQARTNPLGVLSTGSLLNWAIYEGTADFIAFTIAGAHSNEAAHSYLASNESSIWCAFFGSTEQRSDSQWLDEDLYGKPPRGLAGAFGYHIAQAYYELGQRDDESLTKLIELEDYDRLYEESGTKARLANLCG